MPEVAAEGVAEEPAVAGSVVEVQNLEGQVHEKRIVVVDAVEPSATFAAFVAHSSCSFVVDAEYPIDVVAVAAVVRDDVAQAAVAVAWRSIVADRGIGTVRRG